MNSKELSQIYHQESKSFEQGLKKEESKSSEEWVTVFYKNYPRFKKIDLPVKEINANIADVMYRRRSRRGMSGEGINLEEVGTLLKYSFGKTEKDPKGFWKRTYPSAGARYPIEAYVYSSKSNKEIGGGIFHYNVRNNQLEKILSKNVSFEDINKFSQKDVIGQASIIIFLTSLFWRTQNKYGERGYRFILQESGHIAQNIYLISEALGLKCCALGGFMAKTDKEAEKLLLIDGVSESLIYCLAIGK